jgi:hypothetical protein
VVTAGAFGFVVGYCCQSRKKNTAPVIWAKSAMNSRPT